MKHYITSLLLFLSPTVFGQNYLSSEFNFLTGDMMVGLQHQPKNSKVGYYISYGGSHAMELFMANTRTNFKQERKFHSSVDWYTQSGTYLPVMPNTPLWTSADYGNQLLEQGSVTNDVVNKTEYIRYKNRIYTMGVVVPIKKNQLKLGWGVISLKEDVVRKTQTVRQLLYVQKYYDSWGTIGGSNTFVVERDLGTYSSNDEQDFRRLRILATLDIGLNIPIGQDFVSLGLDVQRGFKIGIVYNLDPKVKRPTPSPTYYPYYPRTYIPRRYYH